MAEVQSVEEKRKQATEFFGLKSPEAGGEIKKTEEELAAEKAEQERLADENKKKEDDLAAEAEKNKNDKDSAVVEPKATLTDAEIFALMSEKSGREIKSWDELKPAVTKEDKEKEQEKRDANKLSYGLQQGIFNKNQYESFIADSKNPKDLVYARELAEAKAEDPTWDAEKEKDFQDEFDEKFGLTLDPTASKYKRGQKQINMLAEQILQKEYAPIFSLDSAYDKHESEINSQRSREQKILAEAPAYKETVTKVLGDFSKVEMDFGGEKFEVPVPENIIKAVSEVMLDNAFSSSQITSGYKKEGLAEFVKQYVIGQNFETLAFEAAKLYRQKHEKGVRGIPAGGKLEKPEDPYANLNDKQKQALDFFRGGQPIPAN